MSYLVQSKENGNRLDHFLVSASGKTRNAVKRLIDSGAVRVNGKRVVIAKWELKTGDQVRVEHEEAGGPTRGFVDVIHEDSDLIAINKPAGIIVSTDKGKRGTGLLDLVFNYLRRKHQQSSGSYVKPVHRLDKETSGVVLFAKSKIGEKLIHQFKTHRVKKEYVAIVEGGMTENEGKIELPLEKGTFPHGQKVIVSEIGKESITFFRVKERYQNATVVELKPLTGRTHQIRAHLAAIGHPIIGDTIYGSKTPLAKRHMLHAMTLEYHHPKTGTLMKAHAKLPEDMTLFINQLRESI